MFEDITKRLRELGVEVFVIFDPDEFGEDTPWKIWMQTEEQLVSKTTKSHETVLVDLKKAADLIFQQAAEQAPASYDA